MAGFPVRGAAATLTGKPGGRLRGRASGGFKLLPQGFKGGLFGPDARTQGKRVGFGQLLPQAGFGLPAHGGARQQALARGARAFVALFDFGSVALFARQFERGNEQILIEAPVLEEVVQRGGEFGLPEALVTGELPDEHAVLLLGVAVVVLAVGPGTGFARRGRRGP